MITDTSLFAYREIKPKLPNSQRTVFAMIIKLNSFYKRPVCAWEIKEHLGWEINRVTGRVNELHKAGLIVDVGMRISPTGYKAHFWEVAK